MRLFRRRPAPEPVADEPAPPPYEPRPHEREGATYVLFGEEYERDADEVPTARGEDPLAEYKDDVPDSVPGIIAGYEDPETISPQPPLPQSPPMYSPLDMLEIIEEDERAAEAEWVRTLAGLLVRDALRRAEDRLLAAANRGQRPATDIVRARERVRRMRARARSVRASRAKERP